MPQRIPETCVCCNVTCFMSETEFYQLTKKHEAIYGLTGAH